MSLAIQNQIQAVWLWVLLIMQRLLLTNNNILTNHIVSDGKINIVNKKEDNLKKLVLIGLSLEISKAKQEMSIVFWEAEKAVVFLSYMYSNSYARA